MIDQVHVPAFLTPEKETPVAFELMVHAHRYVETVHCFFIEFQSSGVYIHIFVGLH